MNTSFKLCYSNTGGLNKQNATSAELLMPAGYDTLMMEEWHVGTAEVCWPRKRGKDWELSDLAADRSELRDLAQEHPQIISDLPTWWNDWATDVGVIDPGTLKRGK